MTLPGVRTCEPGNACGTLLVFRRFCGASIEEACLVGGHSLSPQKGQQYSIRRNRASTGNIFRAGIHRKREQQPSTCGLSQRTAAFVSALYPILGSQHDILIQQRTMPDPQVKLLFGTPMPGVGPAPGQATSKTEG